MQINNNHKRKWWNQNQIGKGREVEYGKIKGPWVIVLLQKIVEMCLIRWRPIGGNIHPQSLTLTSQPNSSKLSPGGKLHQCPFKRPLLFTFRVPNHSRKNVVFWLNLWWKIFQNYKISNLMKLFTSLTRACWGLILCCIGWDLLRWFGNIVASIMKVNVEYGQDHS